MCHYENPCHRLLDGKVSIRRLPSAALGTKCSMLVLSVRRDSTRTALIGDSSGRRRDRMWVCGDPVGSAGEEPHHPCGRKRRNHRSILCAPSSWLEKNHIWIQASEKGKGGGYTSVKKTKATVAKMKESDAQNVRLMFQHEAGFGRINKTKSCWSIKGQHPSVPCHHIREYRYAYGTIESLTWKGNFLPMPTMIVGVCTCFSVPSLSFIRMIRSFCVATVPHGINLQNWISQIIFLYSSFRHIHWK